MTHYLDLFKTSIYAFSNEKSILEDKDIGICSDVASVMTPAHSVAAMKHLQGCPYTNSAFRFDIKLDGETVVGRTWKWLPNAILREGAMQGLSVQTLTAAVPQTRTMVMKITVKNTSGQDMTVPVTMCYRGHTLWTDDWGFLIPKAGYDNPGFYAFSDDCHMLSSLTEETAYRLTTSLDGMSMFGNAYLLEGVLTVPAGKETVFYVSAHMGTVEQTLKEAETALAGYETLIEQSFAYFQRESDRIYQMLPRLSSDNPALDLIYYRSLVTYILCRWENPDIGISPYYSTGSITGGCMCSYLWDYCGGLMMHPIFDFEGNKKQLRAYLANDLTDSYALNPVTMKTLGPWYHVNQEKIICMVYHHIRATGDRDFLFEEVAGKTVVEWMRYHAYVLDDLSREAELCDYGEAGNSHLEIHGRGNGLYNGVIPDLNARRYMNYMRAYELTKLAGQPDEQLVQRAQVLKQKLKTLWNEDAQWYDYINHEGVRSIRYTVQMFKFLASGVIDEDEREALISHLNEREFLSKYGLHSMSKLDTEYDQDDIDNGGGGICTHFTMQICAQLYEMGYDALATDIFRRVFWWGELMPFMGDSCAANMKLNRENTPLQGDISSVSCAQMVFFYIFGITPHFDGHITVCPVKNRPARRMQIDNARLCGKVFSVCVDGDRFSVELDNKTYQAAVGETVTLT